MQKAHEESLLSDLSRLPAETLGLLKEHGFDPEWLTAQADFSRSRQRTNVVSGNITLLDEAQILSVPAPGTAEEKRCKDLGETALSEGRCALSVLAGGMATRMGGVVKALVPAAGGKTFLELRLAEQQALKKRYGALPPLWLMTSHATHRDIEIALEQAGNPAGVSLFRQGLSVRLTEEGEVFRTADGKPSLHATGHGDFVDCLKKSGLLKEFVTGGGTYVLSTNLDNLGGGLDPVLIGMHLSQECAVTSEVVDKEQDDRGGIPVRLDGKPVVLEEFRLPPGFDPSKVRVFNVNSFAFDASQLLDLEMEFTFFEVKKNVEGQTGVQYERLINEVTFHLPTQYVRVPRVGAASRFLPVKDHAELKLRNDELNLLAAERGMITPP